jgi:arsenate reductase
MGPLLKTSRTNEIVDPDVRATSAAAAADTRPQAAMAEESDLRSDGRHRERPQLVLFSSFFDASRGPLAAAVFNGLADPAKATATSAGLRPARAFSAMVRQVAWEAGLTLASSGPRFFDSTFVAHKPVVIHLGSRDNGPVGATLWRLPYLSRGDVNSVRRLRADLHTRLTVWLQAKGWLRARPAAVDSGVTTMPLRPLRLFRA